MKKMATTKLFPRMCYAWVTLALLTLPLAGRAQVIINEIMAANVSTAPLEEDSTYFPDYIELYNTGTTDIDLGAEGWTLTDDIRLTNKFRFPPGTIIHADSFLLVFCDNETNLTVGAGALHTGFNLDAKGGEWLGIYKTNAAFGGYTLVCSNAFGIQVPGFSVGRIPSGSGDPNGVANFTLNIPTPCGVPYPIPSRPCFPNIAASFVPAPSSSNQFTLKINEWQATNSAGVDRDWIELYNPDTNIVELSGLGITDDQTILLQHPFFRPVRPLSYIAPLGYVQLFASGVFDSDQANHVDFRLSSGSDDPPPAPGVPLDKIFVFAPGRNPTNIIDTVNCYLWRGRNLSEGRVPDGEERIIVFPNPTPEDSNFGRITNVVIHELLSHTDPPLEDAIKFYNPTTQPVDISHWWLSNRRNTPRLYQFPPGTIVPPLGYYVAYEYQFNDTNNHPTTAFTFNSARGDEAYLFAANTNGVITGFRTGVAFGPADNSVSFVRYVTSDTNVEFVASQDLGFGSSVRAGMDPGLIHQFRLGQGQTNAPPVISPVVINEIYYHPPDYVQGTNRIDNADDEFIELRNITSTNVPLFYAPRDGSQSEIDIATNGWHLDGDVRFDFPALNGVNPHVMLPNTYVIIVNFDPDTNALHTASWRARFGVPAGVRMFGPYRGRLSNNSGSVRIERPDRPQPPGRPDAGHVPNVLLDRIAYNDRLPWPTNGADGGGFSLQRRYSYEFGNDPTNWFAALPTAGGYNSLSRREPPYILVQPVGVGTVEPGANVQFTCLARGDNPLTYRWHRNGIFSGVTGTTLTLNNVGSPQAGNWTCVVSNIGGITVSAVAELNVNCPFFLNHSLAGFPISGGSSNIVVTGTNGCEWTIENVPPWVTITSGLNYNGSGVVEYTVAPNVSGQRSVTLRVAGLNYVIAQTPADFRRPTFTVTAPAAGARVTNSTVIVRGTASDNVRIGNLFGQVAINVTRPGDFTSLTVNATNIWSAPVSLLPGTNWIRVHMQDFANNYSTTTNTRAVLYAVPTPVRIFKNGTGTVAGAVDNQRLDIGRNYTLTATPGAGSVFSHWSLNFAPVSSSNRLTFTMQTGLIVSATFVPNPYRAVRGTYDGLFRNSGDVHHTNAGSFKMVTADQGTYTVSIQLAGKKYMASGRFALDPNDVNLPTARNVIARPGQPPMSFDWILDTKFFSGYVTGFATLPELGAFPLVEVKGARSIYLGATNRSPLAGKYTMVIPGTTGATDRPQGDGFGTVVVAPAGTLTFSGTLADGTPVTHGSAISQNGEWPLYVSLYGGRGSLVNWINFNTNEVTTDLSSPGPVIWTRPPLTTTPFYRNGFETGSDAYGSRYIAPIGATNRILAMTNAWLALTGGNLPPPLFHVSEVILGRSSRVTNASPNRLSVTFNLANGLFTGTYTPAGFTRVSALRGVALQKTNIASGFFFGTNEVGRVWLEKVPDPPPVD